MLRDENHSFTVNVMELIKQNRLNKAESYPDQALPHLNFSAIPLYAHEPDQTLPHVSISPVPLYAHEPDQAIPYVSISPVPTARSDKPFAFPAPDMSTKL
jgi:hypothetical protein